MIYALLSLLPAAGLLVAFPMRPWAAWAAFALSAAVGGLVVVSGDPAIRDQVALVAAWACGASIYAAAASRRGLAGRQARLAALEAVRRRRDELARQLGDAKAKGAETGREQKETLTLYGMIKSLSEALSWEEVRPKLETAVDQYLGLNDFALYAAGVGETGGVTPLTVRHLAGSPGASWAALERCLQEQRRSLDEGHILESPESAIFLPIRDEGEPLGFFYARVPKGVGAPELLAKARTFTAEIAFAFKRVKLFQEVERLSQVDGLTGVYRRGVFDDRLRQEAVRAQTFKTTCGLLILDIDHFKKLNDRYGHPFGDQVLKRVGEILNASVYETDFVARYGGEEFVILLPRAQAAGALKKAEAIRHAIEAERFAIALETVQVTVSIGIAHFPRDASVPEDLVAAADQALYQAKGQGRNRVIDYSTMSSAH